MALGWQLPLADRIIPNPEVEVSRTRMGAQLATTLSGTAITRLHSAPRFDEEKRLIHDDTSGLWALTSDWAPAGRLPWMMQRVADFLARR